MPKGNEIAQAYISIIPEMSGIQGKIAKELNADVVGQSEGKKLGGGVLSGFGSVAGRVAAAVGKAALAGTAAAATGIAALTKSALDGFSQYEQLAGGAKQIFDQMDFGRISSDAQNAYRTMGMSANEYLESINQVGAAFAATMGDEAGYETAKRGMQAISDYASGTGRDLGELNEKYQMITRSTSSYQSIADQFAGILPATSADFLEQAQAAGFLSGEYTKLTEVPVAEYQQAVTQMLEKGVDSLNLTGNTAREATETISGSVGMMKASWANFVTELGKDDADIEARTSELVDSAIAVAENVIPRVGEILTRLGSELPRMVKELAPKLGDAIKRLLDEVTGGAFSKALAAIQPAMDKVGNAASKMMKRFEPLAPVVKDIGEKIGTLLVQAVNIAADAFDWLAPIVATFAETVLPILDGALGVVCDAIDAVMPLLEPIGEFLSGALSEAIVAAGESFEDFSEDVGAVFNFLKDGLQAVANFFKDKFGWIAQLFGINVDEISSDASRMDANVSASASNMASKVGSRFSEMNQDVASKASSAASTSETEAARMERAWDRSLTTNLYAQADTWNAEASLSNLYNSWNGRTIWFNTGGGGGFGGSGGGGAFAAGAIIQKHANGFIVDRPGRGVDITRHIAGESGGEAIIPLTNRSYVAPFAKVVADFVNERTGGVTVTGNTFVVRRDSDIRAVAIAINQQAERERRGRL